MLCEGTIFETCVRPFQEGFGSVFWTCLCRKKQVYHFFLGRSYVKLVYRECIAKRMFYQPPAQTNLYINKNNTHKTYIKPINNVKNTYTNPHQASRNLYKTYREPITAHDNQHQTYKKPTLTWFIGLTADFSAHSHCQEIVLTSLLESVKYSIQVVINYIKLLLIYNTLLHNPLVINTCCYIKTLT